VSALSNVSVLVAAIGLQEVQSVLNAIHNADAYSAARLQTSADPIDSYCPRPALTPEPRYLPRQVIHPTPRYLPRPVLHPTPRTEPSPLPPPNLKADVPHITAGPQPPWKIQPWQEPPRPPDVIKVVVRPPDMLTKGSLIDLFI
jgi:hypothetical protein